MCTVLLLAPPVQKLVYAPVDAQSAGLSVPMIGCYQFHYVRDSVGNVYVKLSGISNQPTENNGAVNPGTYLSERQIEDLPDMMKWLS